MKKAHPIAADTIQFIFCSVMGVWSMTTFQDDRSHAWTRYWWLFMALAWAFWTLAAFDRLWKRFREGASK